MIPRARRARGGTPVDPDTFAAVVEQALAAFTVDVSYAVAMARAAVVISTKRRVWSARRELREAEARAHAECVATGPFDCHAQSPCGVGDCKFARGEHAAITAPAAPGTTVRPQRGAGTYSLEPAVTALADRRAGCR